MTARPYGPARAEVVRVKRSDGTHQMVRVDIRDQEGDWETRALFEAADLWWVIPALQSAQTEAVIEVCRRRGIHQECAS